MIRPEEASDYGWYPANSVPSDRPVPEDLVQFYREFQPGYYGYVCPACKCVFAPGWGETIPAQFRAHIRPWQDGKGCFLAQKAAQPEQHQR